MPRNRFHILIPQKTLDRAKTRLRAVLAEEDRLTLVLALLRRTLETCARVPGAEGLMVNGPPEVEALAAEFGAAVVPGGLAGMRRDVAEVAQSAAVGEEHALLIVSSDLPLINGPDLERVVAAWRAGHEIVLVPDRRGRGTNVMMADRPEAFPYAFGGALDQGSFETHLTQAQGTGLTVAVLRLPDLALDLDLPADLAVFAEESPDDPLARFCLSHARESFLFE
jgi:2-phospho-L-lactate guanylyltransferase